MADFNREQFIQEMQNSFENITSLAESLKTAVDQTFTKMCQGIFLAVPELKTISWTQYAPYFNDGDPCTFNIQNEVSFSRDQWTDVEPFHCYEKSDEEVEKCREITMFENFIYYYADDMGRLFGGDVFVRVHKDGIQVDKYGEHD
jgi:hypothetical protein